MSEPSKDLQATLTRFREKFEDYFEKEPCFEKEFFMDTPKENRASTYLLYCGFASEKLKSVLFESDEQILKYNLLEEKLWALESVLESVKIDQNFTKEDLAQKITYLKSAEAILSAFDGNHHLQPGCKKIICTTPVF